ncbi:MAG: hypothetical protein AABY64_11740 [Bdellovibrionota bacterium]
MALRARYFILIPIFLFYSFGHAGPCNSSKKKNNEARALASVSSSASLIALKGLINNEEPASVLAEIHSAEGKSVDQFTKQIGDKGPKKLVAQIIAMNKENPAQEKELAKYLVSAASRHRKANGDYAPILYEYISYRIKMGTVGQINECDPKDPLNNPKIFTAAARTVSVKFNNETSYGPLYCCGECDGWCLRNVNCSRNGACWDSED